MKYDLSILMPAIRVEKWNDMYKSIGEAFKGTWELVIITSKDLPEKLKDKDNIKMIYSRRSPMGKQQEGLCQAEGKYITVVSDDSEWEPNALDKTFKEMGDHYYQHITVLKYLEGKEFDFPKWYIHDVEEDMRFKTNYDFMKADKYYFTGTHDSSKMPGIPHNSPILSVAIITKELLEEIGGWDCRFQSQAMGNIDLAARIMNYGCTFTIQDLIVSRCGYMKQDTGDHGPIHYAQIEDDQPLLEKIYAKENNRAIINLDNWKDSPEIWERGKDVN